MTGSAMAPKSMRTRALRAIVRGRDGTYPYRVRLTRATEAELLAYAAIQDDETILGWRNAGTAVLRWIRDHQPAEPTTTYTAPDPAPPTTILAEVLKRMEWRVEVFWNSAGGWFTACLISPWDRDGNASYPGGFLAPFDSPIGASGATPAEAIARLEEAVLEWA